MWLYVPETPPEVSPDDLAVLSLYTGSSMLDEALAAGWKELTGRRSVTVGRCERDSYAAASIVARVEDEALDRAPIWDDSRTFPCRTFRKKVGAVTAGFPCQPWSNAGARLGIQDPRWLWPDIARIVRGVGAGVVLLENVPPILCDKAADEPGWRYPPGAWFVLRDLAAMGFDAEWCVVSANSMGACHERQRWFCLAVHHSVRDRLGPQKQLPARRNRSKRSDALCYPEGLRLGKAERRKAGGQRSHSSGPGSVSDAPRKRGRRLPARQRPQGQGAADAQRALAESLPHPARVGERKPGTEERTITRRKRARKDARRRSGKPLPHTEDAATAKRLSKRASSAQSRSGEPEPTPLPDSRSCGRPQSPEDVRQGQPESATSSGDSLPDADLSGAQIGEGQRCDPREERETLERSRREMFAPGPDGWGPLWDTPLAPAVEPGVCVLVDGIPLVVDASRTDQLRVSGNGVVALEAAVATVVLGRRLGI